MGYKIKKDGNYQNRGAATLIYVALLAIIAVLLLTASYSRLLLSLKRNVSFSDKLTVNYQAESDTYNILHSIEQGYVTYESLPLPIRKDVGDTKVTIEGSATPDGERVEVTAERLFAVSKIRATRGRTSTGIAKSAVVIVGIDCTGSMSSSDARRPDGSSSTRWFEQHKALLAFINTLKDAKGSGSDLRLGIVKFVVGGTWLESSRGGEVLTPTDDFDYLSSSVASLFGESEVPPGGVCNTAIVNKKFDGSNAGPRGGTSVGTTFSLGRKYFDETTIPDDTRRVIVNITDGAANARLDDPACSPVEYCSNYGRPPGSPDCSSDNSPYDYLACSLTEAIGDNIDSYAVTILNAGTDDALEIEKTKSVLDANATGHYTTDNAGELTEILIEIASDIKTSTTSVIIEKVLP